VKRRVRWKTASVLILLIVTYSVFAAAATMPALAKGEPTPKTVPSPDYRVPIAPMDGDPVPGGPSGGAD